MDAAALSRCLDHLPDGLLVLRDGVVLHASARACEILGQSERRIKGNRAVDCLPDGVSDLLQRLDGGASTCTARDLASNRPSARRLTVAGSPGPEPGTTLLLVRPSDAPSDPGERERFRQQLGFLSGLAAGVAHEVRNPLGGIRGAAQLLRRAPGAAEVDELTALVIRECDRISGTIERLVELGRPRPLRRDAVAIPRLLDEEIASLPRSSIRLDRDFDPSLPAIEGDALRLRELFGNLLRNAGEAAITGVTVRARVEGEGSLHEAGTGRGRAVRIAIEDDGPGLDPRARDRLFVPFATTKPGGTGLGLFVARRAAEEHGADLMIRERNGGGVEATVLLWERLPEGDGSP